MTNTVTYKPAFKFAGQFAPSTNALAFASYDEAYANAADKFRVWTMPISFLVVESSEPVNYRYDFDTHTTVGVS